MTAARPPGYGEPAPALQAWTTERPLTLAGLAGRELHLVFVAGLGGSGGSGDAGRRAACRAAIRGTAAGDPPLLFVAPELAQPPPDALREAGLAGRVLLDTDGAVAAGFGMGRLQGDAAVAIRIDRALRVIERRALDTLDRLPEALAAWRGDTIGRPSPRLLGPLPPVLTIDKVFEPAFAAALVRHFEREGGVETGFMTRDGALTRGRMDRRIKRRRDVLVSDAVLVDQCRKRILYRLAPAIAAAFQFEATRIERYLVARYDAEDRGTFQPHRDNDTSGTAHRRFAVSVNLNDGYEGGCLRFPEFGDDLYRPSAGSALVFSCSLLHEATPVTSGARYVFLTFLFGERDVATFERNRSLVVDDGRGALADDRPR